MLKRALIVRHAGLLGIVVFLISCLAALGATIVVNDPSGADHPTGCSATGMGQCTLWDAILFANFNPGPDVVEFDIAGPGIHTIGNHVGGTMLISETLSIDGYSQTGASPNSNPPGLPDNAVILIELQSTLMFGAGGNLVRGLAINNTGTAISLSHDGNRVEGNFIGTDPTGRVGQRNLTGILITGGSGDIIGGDSPDARNVISGNDVGIDIESSDPNGPGHVIQGNVIGVDATGRAPLGNVTGILIKPGVIGTLIGGASGAIGNTISGNGLGLDIQGDYSGVQGNLIGTDSTGKRALGNSSFGMTIDGAHTLIGGYLPNEGNVISANGVPGGIGYGVFDRGEATILEGNVLGLDASRTVMMGNLNFAIVAEGTNTVIGGTMPNAGNVLIANGGGILISGSAVGVLGNKVFSNQGMTGGFLGIDINGDGVTANEPCGPHGGPNGTPNHPVLTAAANGPGFLAIDGTLEGIPSTTYRIEFFANDRCNPSGYGEGQRLIGVISVTTDSSCMASYHALLQGLGAPAGSFLTAVATDASNNSSEFSACLILVAGDKTLTVDRNPASGSQSNLNGVLEPGETVVLEPAWQNETASPLPLTGTGDLTGPEFAVYTLNDGSADYGSIAPGDTADCLSATGNCYEVTVALISGEGGRPARHWDAGFQETLNATASRLWTLHVGESFDDVLPTDPVYPFVETLFHFGISNGCSLTSFCPGLPMTRAQMAVLLLRARYGQAYTPPPALGTAFADVPVSSFAAAWIEQIFADHITAGCGAGDFCPGDPPSRAAMAVFLLRAEHGASYSPPPCLGLFADVPCPGGFAADWIEQLSHEGVTAGCGGGNFCPNQPVTRGQAAVLLSRTFGLSLYGPN